MSIYVDDMRAPFGRMIMCHMWADTHHELMVMAYAIGVSARWIQYAGTYREHFDISLKKRAEAIKRGAVEVSYTRDYPRMINARRDTDALDFYYSRGGEYS